MSPQNMSSECPSWYMFFSGFLFDSNKIRLQISVIVGQVDNYLYFLN